MNTQPITFITKKSASEYLDYKLADNKKMPCKTFNLSAWDCKTGGILADDPKSVCHGCYAKKSHYLIYRENHAPGYDKRMRSIDSIHWVDAIIKLIGDDKYFRWFASGDLQSVNMLNKIVQIAEKMPNTKFWLPTHEPKIIKGWLKEYKRSFPKNLIIRLSAVHVDKESKIPKSLQGHQNILTSTVHTIDPIGNNCLAPKQNGACESCRACWDTKIKNVSYKAH